MKEPSPLTLLHRNKPSCWARKPRSAVKYAQAKEGEKNLCAKVLNENTAGGGEESSKEGHDGTIIRNIIRRRA